MGLFGSITRTLFGGSKNTSNSKSESESGNQFAGQLNSQFTPWMQTGTQGMGQAANILGFGGSEAHAGAMDDYWNSSGGKFQMEQGLDQVDAAMRARGLGQSGAAMKAMEDYRSGLASTKLNEYLGNVNNVNQLALGAGGIVSDAGKYSESESESQSKGTSNNGGLSKFIGALMASDPNIKTDIEQVGTVGVYRFRYKDDPEGKVYVGFMADEIERELPHAAGPRVDGIRTIDLTKLGKVIA